MPHPYRNILALSPHLDDAVFACGELLAQCPDALVATVFAGVPPDSGMQTSWDAASGFASAQEALERRRAEDRSALQRLSAGPVWLDFCDNQYGVQPAASALADAIDALLGEAGPATILFPAGLFHSDHARVHEAALAARRRRPGGRWLMYEEPSYRRIPGLLQQRLARLLSAGLQAAPESWCCPAAAERKREAVHCYASQLRALERAVKDGYADVFAPERFWLIDAAGGQA